MVSIEQVPVRLIPRWYTAVCLTLLSVALVVFLVAGLVATGPMGVASWGLAVFAGALLVAAFSALARPRRPRELPTLPDGTRVLVGPRLTVVSLLVAWAAASAVIGIWVVVAVTDFREIEAPGATLLAVIGAIGMLPDLVRLLTGRLHRWRLEIGPETVRYRGYRTDVTYRRRDVRGGLIHLRHPAGVEIDLRGGAVKGAVVPATAFDVPAEQIIEELRRR